MSVTFLTIAACGLGLALLWGRLIAVQMGWPTWLVAGSLAALGAMLGPPLGWRGSGTATAALTALGLAMLAERQLRAPETRSPPSTGPRSHIWWATLGAGCAIAGLLAPPLWPPAVLPIARCVGRLRQGDALARWGLSSFVVTLLFGMASLHAMRWPASWPLDLVAPSLPPSTAIDAALDVAGPFGLVFSLLGLGVACWASPWTLGAFGLGTLFLAPAPWTHHWPAGWPWGFTFVVSAVLGLGWLASRPKRPALRIALWSALLVAAVAPAWAGLRL